VVHLLESLYVDPTNTLPLYIGDDTTDEDAFRAIEDKGIGIIVSDESRDTAARYLLRDPSEVERFLEELIGLFESDASVSAWSLVYDGFKPENEKLREALCTIGNGYFASRGAAPESSAGEVHYPGTYMAGIYNRLESRVSGETVENESMVNLPNWMPVTFQIEGGEWFDLQSAKILDYRQELDMRRGVLLRELRFQDDHRRTTRVAQIRFVHMKYEHLAGLETMIIPENWSGRIRVRSALDGRVENSLVERYRQLASRHLNQVGRGGDDEELIWIEVETNQSHIRVAEAARTRVFVEGRRVEAPPRIVDEEGYVAHEHEVEVETSQAVRVEKIASIYSSRDAAISESLIEARGALAHVPGFADLLEDHAIAWKHLWQKWRIDVDADSGRKQRVLNLHIFHLLQTVSPNTGDLDSGVPPRGLHGEAYRGLIMWDELFVFPLLNFSIPDIARGLLMYRYRRLRRATWAARREGYEGAMFPWQSGSNGEEQAQTLHLNPESGRWIADNSQLERHINIAIAYNVWQYFRATGDEDFLSLYGAELFVEIARFWASKAVYDERSGRYEIRRVMGPDEFHEKYPGAEEPGIDNNAYTNVMVAWLFCRASEILDTLPEEQLTNVKEKLKLEQRELDEWHRIGHNLRVDFHDDGIISQFQGYGDLEEFDWEGYQRKYGNIQRLDRILEAEGDSPNRYKVSKQADVLMLFYLLSADELGDIFGRLGYPFEHETIPRNVDYYMRRTSHGSTLSRIVHAWVLSRSKREMSWHLFEDALESDIEDIQGGTTREGIHLGAMAGTIDLVMRCYSGMEIRGDVLWFNPRLPSRVKSLDFSVLYRRGHLDVSLTKNRIRLHLRPGKTTPLRLGFVEESFPLGPGETKVIEL
jgi:alpha,alpha-trehalase